MSDQDFLTPKYENRDVVEITRIPVGTVQNWVNRGFFQLAKSEQAPGRGVSRLYCLLDLVLLETARVLIHDNVPISSAVLLVNSARDPWESLKPQDRTVTSLSAARYAVFYRDSAAGASGGRDPFVVQFYKGLEGVQAKMEAIFERHEHSDLVWTVPFGNIVKRIGVEIANHERRKQLNV